MYPLLEFLGNYALWIFMIIGVAVCAFAVYTKKAILILLGIHIVLIGFFFDYFYPPYTPCAYLPPEQAYSGLVSAGLTAWADDSAVCKFFIVTFPNITIASFNLPHPLIYYVSPIFLLLIFIFTSLSLRFPRFWATDMYMIIFGILTAYLTKDMIVNSFYFTTATVFTYIIFPLVLGVFIAVTNPFMVKK